MHKPKYECTNPNCPGKPYHPNGMTWNEVNEFYDPPTCLYVIPETGKACGFPVKYLGNGRVGTCGKSARLESVSPS